MPEKHEKRRGEVIEVPLTEIVPSRWQARRQFDRDNLRELAISIQTHGLIYPPLVFRDPESEKFELIAGERRYRASLAIAMATGSKYGRNLSGCVGLVVDDWQAVRDLVEKTARGIQTMPVEVREGLAESFHEIAIVDNLQREDITPIEEAEAFNSLMICNDWTQKDLGEHLGKSPAYVSQRLGLLDLAEEVKDQAAAGAISFSAARAISTVPESAQGAVLGLVSNGQQGDDPASSREVASMAGAARRFLDPDRWQPAEDDKTTPTIRNRFRLLRYHIGYMMANDPERAAEAVRELGAVDGLNRRYLTKKPATIAGTEYQTAAVLQVLTGGDVDPSIGVKPYWAPYAKLRGDRSCKECRFSKLEPVPGASDRVHCPRWHGEELGTCPGWLGPDDPIWIVGDWDIRDAIAGDLDTFAEGIERLGFDIEIGAGRFYFDDLDQYRRAVALAVAYKKEREERQEHQRLEGWREPMREYWQAQPAGLGARFDLANVQAHACRLCGNYRPELEADRGAPCRLAAEPLQHWYHKDRHRAPDFAVMVRADGRTVPRCERFRAAEVPTLDPVRGVRFPDDPDGRAGILAWLRRILVSRGDRFREHEGALMGILAWLPYDRPDGKAWDPELAIQWIAEHWRECGADRGVARLINVAISEHEAREQGAPFDLMDPTTAEIHKWIAVPWHIWANGERSSRYGLSDEWPQPWAEPTASAGDGDQA